ncbi:MAG: type I restriction endonuclease [Pseudomonadota bacterium]
MDNVFEEKLRSLSALAVEKRAHLQTEEAVKTAVILHLFQCLGYNPFDPREIIPEYTADVGIRKGEKVDYAISIGGKISILVECKSPQSKLSRAHASQLYRYFSVTDARFAVLTNGYDWEVYTDLDAPNKMDERPFLSFDLTEIDQTAIQELAKFKKAEFDVENIIRTASNLKYVSALKLEIRRELSEPSEDFVQMLVRRVYDGRVTSTVKDEFEKLIARSVKEVLRDKVNARLSSALLHNVSEPEAETEEGDDNDIETTQEEWDGFRTATAIASQVIDPDRIHIRDTKSYCGVLVDDNNRRPLVRLYFNSKTTRHVGLFDGETEERVRVERVTDLYKYADRIRATAAKYD